MDQIKKLLQDAGDGAYLSNSSQPRAHKVVMKVARSFCGELYEVYASRKPGFYEAFPSQNEFIRQYWIYFIGAARATLAQMLASNIDDDLKKIIHDGLIKDASLASTRKHVPQIDLTK